MTRRWRLLPHNEFLGWTPYVWLVYLPIILIDPIARTAAGNAPLWLWPSTILVIAIFLYTYFRGHWVHGRALVPIVLVQIFLAVALAPINTGASVFFVYSASFAARLTPARTGIRTVLVIALLGALTSYLVDAPLYFWITSVSVTLLIGGVNWHFAQAGRAQFKLRLAQEEVEHLAAVAERERIARDLHDVLGHTLSLIILKSELASKLADRDTERAIREIRDVEAVSRKALQEVREAIRGYRATLEDEVARARSLLKAADITGSFDVQPVELPRAQEETLALALREAVTNVVRHSRAHACSVVTRRVLDSIVLTVEDDGRGAETPEGAGLRGMRERIEVLGGRLERDGRRGARLTVTLPLDGAS